MLMGGISPAPGTVGSLGHVEVRSEDADGNPVNLKVSRLTVVMLYVNHMFEELGLDLPIDFSGVVPEEPGYAGHDALVADLEKIRGADFEVRFLSNPVDGRVFGGDGAFVEGAASSEAAANVSSTASSAVASSAAASSTAVSSASSSESSASASSAAFGAQSASSASVGSESSAKPMSTDERPTLADFKWITESTASGKAPAGATAITDIGAALGGWKLYMYGEGMEWFANAKVDAAQSGVAITVDWYYVYDGSRGEGHDDNSPDSQFAGSWDKGMVDATGPGRLTVKAFWEQDGHQYAAGTFMWPSGETSTVALARP